MKIRQATMNDYNQIMAILKDGANQLAERGVDQWQGDYPSPDQIKDIEKGFAYLLLFQLMAKLLEPFQLLKLQIIPTII